MAEYSSRSNDPRITMGGKKDKYKYDMALEVARQPATTPERKRMKKDAQNYVRAFESRFQNEAFVRSGRDPYTAGGKGAAKDETKVNKVAAKTTFKNATIKVTKKLSQAPKRTPKNAQKMQPITKKSAATLTRKPKAGPTVKMTKKAGKK
jgi:hypothetical protein